MVAYQIYTVRCWRHTGQTLLQKYFGERVVDMHGNILSTSQSIKRLLVRLGLLLAPFVAAGILSGLLSLVGASGLFGMFAFVFFLGYAFWNAYVLWISEHNQFLHDKIC